MHFFRTGQYMKERACPGRVSSGNFDPSGYIQGICAVDLWIFTKLVKQGTPKGQWTSVKLEWRSRWNLRHAAV